MHSTKYPARALLKPMTIEEQIIANSADGVFAFDLECRLVLWNHAMERISGLERDVVLRKSVFELFPSLIQSGEDQFFRRTLKGEVVTGEHLRYFAKRADPAQYESSFAPLLDEAGEIIGGFSRVKEIIRNAEQSDQLNGEDRYRQLVESGLGLICVHDLDANLLSVNPAAARSLGYTPEEMTGRNLRDFVAPAMHSRIPGYLSQLRKEGASSGVLRVITSSGEERLWAYRNRCYEEPGKPPFVLGHGQDITEREEAKERLRKAKHELERCVQTRTAELTRANEFLQQQIIERRRAEKALKKLAVRLSRAQEEERRRIALSLHDESGQTLTAIAVRLHILEGKLNEQRISTGEIIGELSELRSLIKKIQENLRQMAHALHPSVIEHFGMVQALRSLILEGASNSNIQVSFDVPEDFPRLSINTENAIYRIVQEAVSNALRHARPKRLSIIFAAENGSATISVRDDGVGFDPKKAESSGGLGLISMRERTGQIGGALSISSAPAKGTEVTLRFKLR